jgi:hypothetical protein
VEIELDDASVIRMVGEGLAELSDYTRLSGGQRITVISVDHGLAYFTGEPAPGDAIHVLAPGAQASLKQGSRIRVNALNNASEIAIIEGGTHLTMPSAEMDLHQGQSARVTIPDSIHFELLREIAPLDSDRWSEQLDKAEAQAPASRLELDRAGKWITTGDYGTVWQPAPQPHWAPFREGRWMWYQSIGYAWVGSEAWGWKPYHEGRWLQHPDLGWVWIPAEKNAAFSPGDVFWARGANLAVWGPLAPGEPWNGAGPPRQFAALNVTGGPFVAGARELLPSSAEDLPKDLLKAFLFTAALPSPPLSTDRLHATRTALRSKLFSAVEIAPALSEISEVVPPPQSDSPPLADAPSAPSQPASAPPPPDPYPVPPPVVLYPPPLVTGVIVVDPPANTNRPNRRVGGSSSSSTSSSSSASSSSTSSSSPSSGGSTTVHNPPPSTGTVIHREPRIEPRPQDRVEPKSPPPHETQRMGTKASTEPVSKPAPPPLAAPPSTPAPAARPPVKVDAPVSRPPAPAKVDAPAKSDTITKTK